MPESVAFLPSNKASTPNRVRQGGRSILGLFFGLFLGIGKIWSAIGNRGRQFLVWTVALSLLTWSGFRIVHYGFMPLDADSQLMKQTLGVRVLPSSLRIQHLEREYLPDLSVEADFLIDPKHLNRLLEHGNFKPVRVEPWEKDQLTQAYYIDGYSGFKIHSRWLGQGSLITVNKEGTRIFLISAKS